jgi:hypothetical protein
VGEVVEVLPPHHPDPDYPVPHLRRARRHLYLRPSSTSDPGRRFPGSLNPDGFGLWRLWIEQWPVGLER